MAESVFDLQSSDFGFNTFKCAGTIKTDCGIGSI